MMPVEALRILAVVYAFSMTQYVLSEFLDRVIDTWTSYS